MRSLALYIIGLILFAHAAVAQNGNPYFNSVHTNGLQVDGTAFGAGIRTVLQANTTYYVNANSGGTAVCGVSGALTCQAGNDSNDGLTAGTPFLTLQHAINVIAGTVDAAGYSITVNLAHGSSANYQLNCNSGPFLGIKTVGIQGDNTSAADVTIVDPSAGNGLTIGNNCAIGLSWVSFADAGTSDALGHINVGSGFLSYANVNFGGMVAGTQMSVGAAGKITAAGPLFVNGGAVALLSAIGPGSIQFNTFHVGISTAMTFGAEVALLADGGEIQATTSTFNGAGVGSVTGARCQIYGIPSTQLTDPNTIFPGSGNCIPNALGGNLSLKGYGTNTLANAGTCSAGFAGVIAYITDSTTVTWGATISGSGTNKVMGFCDGANWTVMAK